MKTPFLPGVTWKMGGNGNGYNLLLGRFQLEVRGKLFPMRTISHWNGLSREMVCFPTLLTFITQLEREQCHLVQNLLLVGSGDSWGFWHPMIRWFQIHFWSENLLLALYRLKTLSYHTHISIKAFWSKPSGWVNTSLLGASRALTWRTGSTTRLRHFIRMAVPLSEKNLAKHCEVWVSGNTSTHFQKFVMSTGKKKKKLDFLKLCCWPRWL